MPAAPDRRVTRVPAPLLALLAVAFLLGTAWSLVTPPFQTPDEGAHVAYAQSLAERQTLPGDAKRRGVSRPSRATAMAAMNADQTAGDPRHAARVVARGGRPLGRDASRACRRRARGRRRAEPASTNPPLSYVVDAAAYKVAGGVASSRGCGRCG